MESIISVLSLIIGGVILAVFLTIAGHVSSIATTLKEMQAEQLKIYKALYLMAQAQGIGGGADKEPK